MNYRKFALALMLSLGLSSHTHAAPSPGLTRDEMNALADRLHSIDFINPSGSHELECSDYRPLKPIQVFLFDGSMGFCPRYFVMNERGENGYSDGKSWTERLNETPKTEENQDAFESIEKALREESKLQNCHLAKNILREPDDRYRKISDQVELHYFSKRGDGAAVDCYHQLVEQAGKALKVRIVGYSMGSDAALEFTNALPEVKVEKVLSIDPVGRSTHWTTGVIITRDNSLFKRPAQVERWDNFYQKIDHQSILSVGGRGVGIRGSFVIDADTNLQLQPEDFESVQGEKHEHVKILRSKPVQQKIQEIL